MINIAITAFVVGFVPLLVAHGLTPRSKVGRQKSISVLPALKPAALSPGDASSYRREMQSLGAMMKARHEASIQLRGTRNLASAVEHLHQASLYNDIAICLYGQRKNLMPYQEARARCTQEVAGTTSFLTAQLSAQR